MLVFTFLSQLKAIHVTQIRAKTMEYVIMDSAHVAIAIAGNFVKLKKTFANYSNVLMAIVMTQNAIVIKARVQNHDIGSVQELKTAFVII